MVTGIDCFRKPIHVDISVTVPAKREWHRRERKAHPAVFHVRLSVQKDNLNKGKNLSVKENMLSITIPPSSMATTG